MYIEKKWLCLLYTSLEGFAITGIKIHGVEHEFATIPGVIEDVTEIILNLKQVRFKRKVEDVEDEKLTVLINGQEAFKAGDINKFLTGFEVLNTELVICHMDPSVNFQMEITIQKGRGYVPVSYTHLDVYKRQVLKGTIPHEQVARFSGSEVYMQPASSGTGLVAGGAMRAVLESAGIHDVLAKSKGSSNPHNLVKATIAALKEMRDARTIAAQRGISLDKVFNG